MFVLQPNPTFKKDVTIPTPGGSEQVLTLVFKYRDADELAALTASLGDEANPREDLDILLDMVAGWEDVDAKFNKEAFAKLLKNYPLAKREIFESYFKAYYEGKEKN